MSGETLQTSLNSNREVPSELEDEAVKERTLQTLRELARTLSVAVDVLSSQEQPTLKEPIDFYEEVRRFEISLIQRALRATGGNQAQAARLLSLNQPTLHGKIKQNQIYPDILLFRERPRTEVNSLNEKTAPPEPTTRSSGGNNPL